MSKEKLSFFSRLQVRYRSDPFSKVGTRWGSHTDPIAEREFEMVRVQRQDEARAKDLRRALRAAVEVHP